MIIEKIDFIEDLFEVPWWKQISPKIFSFWKSVSGLSDQKYDIVCGTEHKGITVNIESYIPKQRSVAQYESHLRMADIQIVLEGDEYIDSFPLCGTERQTSSDLERDLIFYADKPEIRSSVHLFPGFCAFILPGEAHMPCLRGQSESVRKMVVKIPVEMLKSGGN